jgi:hypothetical protein
MFTSITWEIFFTSILLIVGSYYIISSLLLYSGDIGQWLKSRAHRSPVKNSQHSTDTHQLTNLMGRVTHDMSDAIQRTSSIAATDIVVSPADDEPEIIQSPSAFSQTDFVIESFTEIIQEIKNLTQLVAEYKTDKVECQSLFHALLIKYPHLLDTPYQVAVNLYICDAAKSHFPFLVPIHEVDSWWKFEATPIQK